MMKVQDITQFLETIAPLSYQESYDNAGLLTGSPQTEVSGVLLTLDCIEEVVLEAIKLGANLIIAHHPIIFSGIKKLNGKNYIERTIISAIKNDIAIYACHTNLDNVHVGVNRKIGEKIGLLNLKPIVSKSNTLKKLITFSPKENTKDIIQALNSAGAGQIGHYKNCAYHHEGIGQFEPTEKASPHTGRVNQLEYVKEDRIEVMYPGVMEQNIIKELKRSHPYEEVAYYIAPIDNENQEVGSGMIGELEKEMNEADFLYHLKEQFNLSVIRHTALTSKKVKKIAVCGGSGSFLLKPAMSHQADFFVTSDFKYHEFFDADGKIVVADIGHYESEVCTKELFLEILSKKFTNIALHLSNTETNPIYYFT